MKSIKLSCAHALFKFLIAQKTIIDGKKVPLFPGAFAIYGHGNVACFCLLYTSPSPRDGLLSRMPSSA